MDDVDRVACKCMQMRPERTSGAFLRLFIELRQKKYMLVVNKSEKTDMHKEGSRNPPSARHPEKTNT